MFSITAIAMKGFKAFQEKTLLNFPVQPGLYLVTGKNNTNPRLGANGVGKSSLLDAIFWCLYGKSTRGLKAGDIVSWGSKSASVEVGLKIAGNGFVIARRQAPNALELNGQPVDQEAINKALRLNADSFLNAVMRSQFGEPFLQLKPADKLSLFSQIMELDLWLEKSNTAAELAKELAQEATQIENKLATVTGKIGILDADLNDLDDKMNCFEDLRFDQIDQAEKLILDQKARIDNLSDTISTQKVKYDAQKTEIKTHEDQITKDTERLNELNGKIIKLESERQQFISHKRKLEDTLRRIPDAGVICSSCRQLVTKAHIRSEHQTINNELVEIDREIANCGGHIGAFEASKQKYLKKLVNSKNGKRGLDTAFNVLFEKVTEATQECKQAENRLAELQARTKELEKQTNPYTAMFEEKTIDLKKLKSDAVKLGKALNETNEDHAAVSHWVTGFKRIRLLIIEQTLKQLEIEINNNLASLGMPEWSITLDIERENKSGGVTKGFVVFVNSPDHAEPVRFEAWSGGETQRLCLAGDLGLANLIMERSGLVGDIEFYDEPSEHLSAEGLLDLAETLAQRAETQNKRILLVDHHLIDYPFTGIISIIKDEKGSRIT